MNLTDDEIAALRHVALSVGRAWRRRLRSAYKAGTLREIASDRATVATLKRLMGRDGFSLRDVRLPPLPPEESQAPTIMLPLTPALAAFRDGLDEKERAIFDARLGQRHPAPLREVSPKVGLPISSVWSAEKELRARLAEAGLEPPRPQYATPEAFRDGLAPRDRTIFDARIAARPPTMGLDNLATLLGCSRQRVGQRVQKMLLDAALGGLTFPSEPHDHR